MTRALHYTNQFKKDFKRLQKQRKNLVFLKEVIAKLVNEQVLDEILRDHPLLGNYVGTRECHLEPDWLLIYRIEDQDLFLVRTGSHAELFK
jgi:mRNA interferase YafQ